MVKTKVAVCHSNEDLGRPESYTRAQLDRVKQMIRQIADGSRGGMQNIVKPGDTVLIKINTVTAIGPENGFTTDPRMLEALIELVMEQRPKKVQIGERCALGGDTLHCMDVCGIRAVAERTGAELVAFEHHPFDMYRIEEKVSFREFPVPRPVRDADVYIGLPKMKVHIHTALTCALKLQFGNLPDYDWMSRNHRDDIYQKIVNLTRAAEPDWCVVESLSACQGNGPFSAYPSDLIRDFNTIFGGSDPVAVDTVAEALMDWEDPGSVPATVLAASQGLGTNILEEIEIVGEAIDRCKRKFRRQDTVLEGKFHNVRIVVGSACEPGCRVMVRMALDAVLVDGTLDRLKRPVTIFTGRQFEPYLTDAEGDIIIYGDCARDIHPFYPDAKCWFSSEQYPNCTPLYSNIPELGLATYIRALAD